mmetsp:Transcript_5412/g.8536  ORF Transcript_5412/g.8536 Transcript_5412/m.8536 type:complete len:106 (+) Transcript_5412:263-580(+)
MEDFGFWSGLEEGAYCLSLSSSRQPKQVGERRGRLWSASWLRNQSQGTMSGLLMGSKESWGLLSIQQFLADINCMLGMHAHGAIEFSLLKSFVTYRWRNSLIPNL